EGIAFLAARLVIRILPGDLHTFYRIMISIDSSEYLNIILCCFVIYISRIQIFPEDVVITVPFRIVLRKVLELELLGIESIFSLDRILQSAAVQLYAHYIACSVSDRRCGRIAAAFPVPPELEFSRRPVIDSLVFAVI